MKSINVLGAGISGLSAAHYLIKKAPETRIRIFEASSRVGGWIKSKKVEDGVVFQQSARTIRPTGAPGLNTLELLKDLNLLDQVVPIKRTHPAAKNRMIYAKGQLNILPNKISDIFKTLPPFSKPLIRFLAKDIFAKKVPKKDESIYDFVNRRFGPEVADYLISPLICGICAGNAKEISVKFLMESLFEKEQKYGSISRGLLADTFRMPFRKKVINPIEDMVQKEKWAVYTFPEGLGVITETLEKDLSGVGVKIELGTKCRAVRFTPKSCEIILDDFSYASCDHLISSISAASLGDLVENEHPQLAGLLRNIPMVTVGVVNLHYKKKLPIADAFGFLIPPSENLPLLGVIFDSSCSSTPDNTILTVMVGGNWFEKHFGRCEDQEAEILRVTLKHLKKILKISDAPDNYEVNILKDCIPQYVVGHKENLRKIEDYIKDNALPISLCGFSYYGVGVNDAILSAKNAVINMEQSTVIGGVDQSTAQPVAG